MSRKKKEPESEEPGKTRTWWHPLLASVLRWQFGKSYRVDEEVNVGKKPLQIDLILLRQQEGDLPEGTRRILAGLLEYLNEYTLVEFKSPSDKLHTGDFQTFLAYALLYRVQNQPLLPVGKLNLVVIAPRLTQPYKDELKVCGATATVEQEGIWRLTGSTFGHAMWLLETDVLARSDHPLMKVFSPRLLEDPITVTQGLRQEGHESLVVYITQQISQFHLKGEAFAMQHLGTSSEMEQLYDLLFSSLTREERRTLVLKMTPAERLEGMSLEERLVGLSPEERARISELAQQEQPKKPKQKKKP